MWKQNTKRIKNTSYHKIKSLSVSKYLDASVLEIFCGFSMLKLISLKSSSNYPGLRNAPVHVNHRFKKACALQRSEGNVAK